MQIHSRLLVAFRSPGICAGSHTITAGKCSVDRNHHLPFKYFISSSEIAFTSPLSAQPGLSGVLRTGNIRYPKEASSGTQPGTSRTGRAGTYYKRSSRNFEDQGGARTIQFVMPERRVSNRRRKAIPNSSEPHVQVSSRTFRGGILLNPTRHSGVSDVSFLPIDVEAGPCASRLDSFSDRSGS